MPLLAPAVLTMVAAQLLDLGTFIRMVRLLGIGAEANPFVAGLLARGGLPELVLAKLALVILVGTVAISLLAVRREAPRRAGWLLLGCAIVAGVVGGWSNVATMGPI